MCSEKIRYFFFAWNGTWNSWEPQFNRLNICFRFYWFFVLDVICKCLPPGSILVKRFVMTLLKSRWCSSHSSPSLKRFWQCYMILFFCKSHWNSIIFTSGRPKNPPYFPQNSSKHEFFFKVRRWLPPGYYCQIPPGFMEGLRIPYQNISPNRKKGWRDDGGSQPSTTLCNFEICIFWMMTLYLIIYIYIYFIYNNLISSCFWLK